MLALFLLVYLIIGFFFFIYSFIDVLMGSGKVNNPLWGFCILTVGWPVVVLIAILCWKHNMGPEELYKYYTGKEVKKDEEV